MAYVLIDVTNNKVTQKQPDPFLGWDDTYEDVTEKMEQNVLDEDGNITGTRLVDIVVGQRLISRTLFPNEPFTEAPDDVVCGQIRQGDGTYANPTVDPQSAIDFRQVSLRAAYEAESDPLFFQWQRGEATQQEWLDKIAEIKSRFPLSS